MSETGRTTVGHVLDSHIEKIYENERRISELTERCEAAEERLARLESLTLPELTKKPLSQRIVEACGPFPNED